MTLQKSVLLIIGGGIAAYKSLDLIRQLTKAGIKCRAILTKSGHEFITPLSVASLTGEKCFTDLFDLTDEAEMGHIQLSRSADLIIVAPATADLMAKSAIGLANDLASTCLLATDTPIMFAPAMNVRMWDNAATMRNVQTLRNDGHMFVGPNKGEMACGEFGAGRMAEPSEICDAALSFFKTTLQISSDNLPLSGKHMVITAGPTHEPIDPVRYIANRSSGKQGYAIASACANLGAQVTLVSGPTNLTPPANVRFVQVQTAQDMLNATQNALPADIALFCAAVADYRPADCADQKIKKEAGGMNGISLTENPDILKTIAHMDKGRPDLVIGFAAETHDVINHATAKRARKKCDWIIANDVSTRDDGSSAMGGDMNRIMILSADGTDETGMMSKTAIAEYIADKIAACINKK